VIAFNLDLLQLSKAVIMEVSIIVVTVGMKILRLFFI
jgi:hypothetical protein